ncbi:hypothetical protein, unlikely [Trypanosoma brucei brucei TREU927]|uniref:Uncharacterized protein n=1 Tax=Trypanosoma brucei brucei (strain 927/4 GUTat10.1) TaxID=185431 RepID=Q4GY76_TRYB2|nr:hypothetical protein, unlikely [Trypanosoma brucei brucei TREU927]CAJ16710.1 hypothetical protein, unlikely [Trypanosoma brucei brucei TREU927]
MLMEQSAGVKLLFFWRFHFGAVLPGGAVTIPHDVLVFLLSPSFSFSSLGVCQIKSRQYPRCLLNFQPYNCGLYAADG